MKDRINASSKSDRAKAPKEQELDLMSGAYSFDESFLLAKKDYAKNFKEALKDFAEKIKKSPNDLNAMNEAFNNLETELERATENLSQKTAPILERYENYKQQALGYGEFLEKEKEGFIVDEQNLKIGIWALMRQNWNRSQKVSFLVGICGILMRMF